MFINIWTSIRSDFYCLRLLMLLQIFELRDPNSLHNLVSLPNSNVSWPFQSLWSILIKSTVHKYLNKYIFLLLEIIAILLSGSLSLSIYIYISYSHKYIYLYRYIHYCVEKFASMILYTIFGKSYMCFLSLLNSFLPFQSPWSILNKFLKDRKKIYFYCFYLINQF